MLLTPFLLSTLAASIPLKDAQALSPVAMAEAVRVELASPQPDLTFVIALTDAVARTRDEAARNTVTTAWQSAPHLEAKATHVRSFSSDYAMEIDAATTEALLEQVEGDPMAALSSWFCDMTATNPKQEEIRTRFCELQGSGVSSSLSLSIGMGNDPTSCFDVELSNVDTGRGAELDAAAEACVLSAGFDPDQIMQEGLDRGFTIDEIASPMAGSRNAAQGASSIAPTAWLVAATAVTVAVIDTIREAWLQEDQQEHERALQDAKIRAEQAARDDAAAARAATACPGTSSANACMADDPAEEPAPAPSDAGTDTPGGTPDAGASVDPLEGGRFDTTECHIFDDVLEEIVGHDMEDFNVARVDPRTSRPAEGDTGAPHRGPTPLCGEFMDELSGAVDMGANTNACAATDCASGSISDAVWTRCCKDGAETMTIPESARETQECVQTQRCREDDPDCCKDGHSREPPVHPGMLPPGLGEPPQPPQFRSAP